MTGSVISTLVNHAVTLDSGTYLSPLTIATTGTIFPLDDTEALLVRPGRAHVSILNLGLIEGGGGLHQGHIGVDLESSAKLVNDGSIIGGAGTTALYGGTGLVDIRIENSGSILGGAGSYLKHKEGRPGGTGIDLGSSATLTNAGVIAGGQGSGNAYGVYGLVAGYGGAGVTLPTGSEVINTGSIIGGGGGFGATNRDYSNLGGVGGDGIHIAGNGTVTNHGVMIGGNATAAAGGHGVEVDGIGMVTNTGTILGGAGIPPASGVDLAGGVLKNSGRIVGGYAQYAFLPREFGLPGAAGVQFATAGTVINSGRITGGGSGAEDGHGGVGVDLTAGGTVINNGAISGGPSSYYGGDAVFFGAPGVSSNNGIILAGQHKYGSGIAVDFSRTGQVTNDKKGIIKGTAGDIGGNAVQIALTGGVINSGRILGGNAAITSGSFDSSYVGGIAVDFATNGQITNESGGTISGGEGRVGGSAVHLTSTGTISHAGLIVGGTGFGAAGGTGVELGRGGTLINAGTIAGGAEPKHGVADAVTFAGAGTLVVDPGATFVGDVVADAHTNGVLVLAGSSAGALDGLGTQFTGFRTVAVAAGADWTLTNSSKLRTNATVNVAGTLDVAGGQFVGAAATISAAGRLQAGSSALVAFHGLTLAGGTLAGSATGRVVVGSFLTAIPDGQIGVTAGTTLSGFGTITGAPVADTGTIDATGGTLTLATAVAGSGVAHVAGGATLVASDTVAITSVMLDSGASLLLAMPTEMSATLSGFSSGDLVDLQNLVAATGTFLDGMLTLENGGSIVDTLAFAGGYSTANFSVQPDEHGGTAITFVPSSGH